jgi:hypothetical protein
VALSRQQTRQHKQHSKCTRIISEQRKTLQPITLSRKRRTFLRSHSNTTAIRATTRVRTLQRSVELVSNSHLSECLRNPHLYSSNTSNTKGRSFHLQGLVPLLVSKSHCPCRALEIGRAGLTKFTTKEFAECFKVAEVLVLTTAHSQRSPS